MLQYIYEPTTDLEDETLEYFANSHITPSIVLKPSVIKLTIINTDIGEIVFTNKNEQKLYKIEKYINKL